MLKSLIKKLLPKNVLSWYHYALAVLSKIIYGNPSNKLLVIGVTGTAGKSSTCYFIAQILETAGIKVGMTTTTLFKIGEKEWLNDKKMTMLGRFQTQKLLKRMVKEKCTVAIIETSSQGVEQFRHIGINYDFAIFTNLYSEHIEAHGSFENYKRAKGKFFKHLAQSKIKKLIFNNRQLAMKKIIIANSDDEYAEYFLKFKADKKITFGLNSNSDIKLNDLKINLLGDYNQYNVLAAVAVARELNLPEEKIKRAVENLKPLPGRLEFIANNLGIKIIVDYSFEPGAMRKLYQTIDKVEHNKLIHVLGSTGGTADKAMQRDKSRRPILGKMAGEKADVVIVTNEDPYDEDPKIIIGDVVEGAMGDNFQFPISNFQTILKFQNSKLKKDIYAILDRQKAIQKSLELAKENDLVLITGKGAEQAMCVANGKMIPWDDRKVVREELDSLNH